MVLLLGVADVQRLHEELQREHGRLVRCGPHFRYRGRVGAGWRDKIPVIGVSWNWRISGKKSVFESPYCHFCILDRTQFLVEVSVVTEIVTDDDSRISKQIYRL